MLMSNNQHHYLAAGSYFFALPHTTGNLGFIVAGLLLEEYQRARKQYDVIPPDSPKRTLIS